MRFVGLAVHGEGLAAVVVGWTKCLSSVFLSHAQVAVAAAVALLSNSWPCRAPEIFGQRRVGDKR